MFHGRGTWVGEGGHRYTGNFLYGKVGSISYHYILEFLVVLCIYGIACFGRKHNTDQLNLPYFCFS